MKDHRNGQETRASESRHLVAEMEGNDADGPCKLVSRSKNQLAREGKHHDVQARKSLTAKVSLHVSKATRLFVVLLVGKNTHILQQWQRILFKRVPTSKSM